MEGGEMMAEGKGMKEKTDMLKNANRPRRAFPVTNPYFGARKPLLGRFV